MLDGEADRRHDAFELAAWTAWHVAALTRTQRLPQLKAVMPKRRRRPVAATPASSAELWRRVEVLNLIAGGSPKRS